jgi:hypothetical protein
MLHQKYIDDMKVVPGHQVVKRSTFSNIFNDDYSNHVEFLKSSNFARCDVCDAHSDARRNLTGDALKLADRKHNETHLADMAKEMNVYLEHKQEALMHPKKCISIVIDGMDQKKTCLPHRAVESHKTATCDRMDCPLIGVLSHAHRPGTMAFYTHGELAKDSSLTCQVLLKALRYIMTNLPADHHPRKLYIQMDNCIRENKNRSIMTMMELLILQGLFDEVHTHSILYFVSNLLTSTT